MWISLTAQPGVLEQQPQGRQRGERGCDDPRVLSCLWVSYEDRSPVADGVILLDEMVGRQKYRQVEQESYYRHRQRAHQVAAGSGRASRETPEQHPARQNPPPPGTYRVAHQLGVPLRILFQLIAYQRSSTRAGRIGGKQQKV